MTWALAVTYTTHTIFQVFWCHTIALKNQLKFKSLFTKSLFIIHQKSAQECVLGFRDPFKFSPEANELRLCQFKLNSHTCT